MTNPTPGTMFRKHVRYALPALLAVALMGLAIPAYTHATGGGNGNDDGAGLKGHVTDLLAQPVTAKGKLSIVFVLDGLRPDSVNAIDTPNLHRLRTEGVNFVNGHAVFPTVTRVNSPSISTGYYPGRAGVVSNSIYVPAVDPLREVNTGDWRVLRKLDQVSNGRLLFVKSLGERLHAAGKKLAAVSSGSSGSALLLNHRAPEGVGVLVSGYLEEGGGRVAWPDAVSDAIIARFGPPPPKSGPQGNFAPVNWTQDVLRDYIIPEVKPDVVLNWITQPDGSQHAFGAGSPEGNETIRNDDRNIGLLLEKLAALGIADQTNIIVISDHGFGWDTYQVNLERSLIDAGLKAQPAADDVVIASSTHVALIHVKNREPRKIEAIVRHLQAQPWTGVLFTEARNRGGRGGHERGGEVDPQGFVDGTFSTDLIHLDSAERGADIVVSFDWSSDKNVFGREGRDTVMTGGTSVTGPRTGNASNHGSMSPWNVRNTWFAWGADFKDGIRNPVPSSNVDVTPTLLALAGVAGDRKGFDGRVLREAIEGGVDYEKVPITTRTLVTRTRGYKAVIQVTEVGPYRYIDKSWRLR